MRVPVEERRLSTILCCPRCGQIAFNVNAEVFVGLLTCGKSRGRDKGWDDGCGAHWWATRLRVGSIKHQLLKDYEDSDFVVQLMDHFQLPESIDQPKFWQIELTGRQLYRYNNDVSPAPRGRSVHLLNGVIALLRPAP